MAGSDGNWFNNLVDSFGKGLSEAGSDAVDYFTSPEGIMRLGSYGLSYLGNKSGLTQPVIPPSGYQGGIPSLQAVRTQVPQAAGAEMTDGSVRPMGTPASTGLEALSEPQPTGRQVQMMYDPNRRPGSAGRRYFTNTQYVDKDDPTAISAAQERMTSEAAQLAEQNIRNPARQSRSIPRGMSGGGLAALRNGGYLSGSTDGMADKVPATIENSQPAALSDGEFVIPADVVSHLGNGNSDAGARVLQQMMARVRKERTGDSKQGKEIKPIKMLPA
jgi:hypothetical protein